jgi:hypothetical protein
MNIVLNALTAFTSYFSVGLQEAVGRSHATPSLQSRYPVTDTAAHGWEEAQVI